MKQLFACGVLAVFALTPTIAAAQEKPTQKEHTMTGCLQKGTEANTFVVANTAEKGPKMIGIVSSTPNLTPHIGHKIDITGTAVPNPEAEKATPKVSKADHYMRITAIKMVGTTCP
jgi:hypothetical protein